MTSFPHAHTWLSAWLLISKRLSSTQLCTEDDTKQLWISLEIFKVFLKQIWTGCKQGLRSEGTQLTTSGDFASGLSFGGADTVTVLFCSWFWNRVWLAWASLKFTTFLALVSQVLRLQASATVPIMTSFWQLPPLYLNNILGRPL